VIGIKIIRDFYEFKKTDLDKAVKTKLMLRQKFHEIFSAGYVLINFDKNNNAYIFKKNYKLTEQNIFD
jgi:predicted GNAT superfamily acetyltransferase